MATTLRSSALLVSLPLLVACPTTSDSTDTTPPHLEFHYRVDEGSTWQSVPDEGKKIEVTDSRVLYLWAEARDHGGVYLCSITGAGTTKCTSGETIDPDGEYESYQEARAPEGGPSGTSTLEERNVVMTIEIADVCGGGDPSGSKLTFQALGQNYVTIGGTTQSGILTVKVH